MKKTFNINVAGFPFTINDDAYELLKDYLDTIEHAFRSVEDSGELINDIESRVAELLLECNAAGSPIISLSDVEDVISRVGKPEEIIEEEDTVSSVHNAENGEEVFEETERVNTGATPPPYVPPLKINKKLYRDPQNAMLGGVCSGLAWYINWEPTWVRLLTVVLTLASVVTCGLVYVILWIVLPEARTPLQRMEMMGEKPTIENIGKTVTDTFKEDSGMSAPPPRSNDAASTLANFFGIIAKVLLTICAVLGTILLISLIMGMLGCIFTLIMYATSSFGTYSEWISDYDFKIVILSLITAIGFILTIGIPLYVLIRKTLTRKKKPLSTTARWTLGVVWAIGFIAAAVCVGMIIDTAAGENDFSNVKIFSISKNADKILESNLTLIS